MADATRPVAARKLVVRAALDAAGPHGPGLSDTALDALAGQLMQRPGVETAVDFLVAQIRKQRAALDATEAVSAEPDAEPPPGESPVPAPPAPPSESSDSYLSGDARSSFDSKLPFAKDPRLPMPRPDAPRPGAVPAARREPRVWPTLEPRLVIANASVGRDYATTLGEEAGLVNTLCAAELTGIEAVGGLRFGARTLALTGTPEHAGDFSLRLSGYIPRDADGRQQVLATARLTVNPDPRSLWTDNEPEPSLPFPKALTASHACDADAGWRLIGASVRGRSHAHHGTHRDDDVRIEHSTASGWSVLAVADGAGSCKYSRRGAEIAVATGLSSLHEKLAGRAGANLEEALAEAAPAASEASAASDASAASEAPAASEVPAASETAGAADEQATRRDDALGRTLVAAARDAAFDIAAEADRLDDATEKDFSTTLLLLAHKRVEHAHLVASFWVGDGAIAALRCERGEVALLGKPDSGEFAGQTRFLDTKLFDHPRRVLLRCAAKTFTELDAVVLATDGVTDPKFDTESAMGTFAPWQRLYDEIEAIVRQPDADHAREALEAWLGFWSPGNHDDRSLALLVATRTGGSNNTAGGKNDG